MNLHEKVEAKKSKIKELEAKLAISKNEACRISIEHQILELQNESMELIENY